MSADDLLALLELSGFGSPEQSEKAAEELFRCIAVNRRDLSFFTKLLKAFRAETKIWHDQYGKERVSIARARRELRRSAKNTVTWQEVVELARAQYGLPMMSSRTLRRVRAPCGSDLPNRTRGYSRRSFGYSAHNSEISLGGLPASLVPSRKQTNTSAV
jgi:hypothetical protein